MVQSYLLVTSEVNDDNLQRPGKGVQLMLGGKIRKDSGTARVEDELRKEVGTYIE